ncbi:MAG: FkbM family methyltransferase [Pseudomonadota bacterium]|nr:FkbM family methyltransferase [Pseudomonadota bacterium]
MSNTMTEHPDHSAQVPGSSDRFKRAELAEMGRPAHVSCHGVTFPTDMPPLFPKARNMLASGTYEEKETQAALKIVQPGDRVVEFGGGLGYLSAVVARNCAPAQVHTFEANTALIPCIRRVHSENGLGSITVHHAILGEARGSRHFYVRRKFFESSTSREPTDGIVNVTEVPVLPARQTVAALTPDVILCDIEGAEVSLLPLLDLETVRHAMVVLHPKVTGLEGVRRVFDTMHGAGLIYAPRHSSNKVVTFARGD